MDTKKNRYKEGTGLGLAISKQLAELMHGNISVESEYGKGSTFLVSVPQKVRSDKRAADIRRKPAEQVVLGARFDNELVLLKYQELVERYQVVDVKLEDAVQEEKRLDAFFTDNPESVSEAERRIWKNGKLPSVSYRIQCVRICPASRVH